MPKLPDPRAYKTKRAPLSTILFVGHGGFDHQNAADTLARAGYSVLRERPRQLVETARSRAACAVVVDENESAPEGRLLCVQLRTAGFVGAVFLVGTCPLSSWLVDALDAGADDYLPAPLDVSVLLARLRAALRRSSPPPPLSHVDLHLVPDETARFASLGATKVRLTPIEARILSDLCEAGGELRPIADLQRNASPEAPLSRASLQVHVANIRTKLGTEGWRVQNCRARGYRLLRSKAS